MTRSVYYVLIFRNSFVSRRAPVNFILSLRFVVDSMLTFRGSGGRSLSVLWTLYSDYRAGNWHWAGRPNYSHLRGCRVQHQVWLLSLLYLSLTARLLCNVEINFDDMNVRVGSGITKNELNKQLAVHGLIFGPDPSSNPSLGMLALK
jgi:hypothetical protein